MSAVQDFGDNGPLYLHCADRAEFLTAEAADAGFAVDDGFAVFHPDRFCRTDIHAFFAAYAAFLFYTGNTAKRIVNELTEKNICVKWPQN